MVVVDTSVWVQFLRLRGSREHRELDRLLVQDEAAMVGAVLAELLQGARAQQEFQGLRGLRLSVPYLSATKETWARVGELAYRLRQQGEMVALVDLLIASLALENNCEVYTLDRDFERIPGVRLYEPDNELP